MTQGYDARGQAPISPAAGIIGPKVDTAPVHALRNHSRITALTEAPRAPLEVASCRRAFKAPACNSAAVGHGSCVAACVSLMPSGLMETFPLIASGSMAQSRRIPTPPDAARGSPAAKIHAPTLAAKPGS